mgnify:CR=1 FL=1
MTERCGACGTDGVTNSTGRFVSRDWLRASELKTERDALAKAIRDAAVKAGICRAGVALTGPQLLMLCDDMATALRPNV